MHESRVVMYLMYHMKVNISEVKKQKVERMRKKNKIKVLQFIDTIHVGAVIPVILQC